MIDAVHLLVERYGLAAVFLGCVAEGESAAVLAGFFAHQHVFSRAGAFLAAFCGAFIGDSAFFLAGRYFAGHPLVRQVAAKPGFSHALQLVARRPAAYVMLNRYAYGFRLIGGIAAGISRIPTGKFLVLNAASSAVWALIFVTVGYLFGVTAEQIVGAELAKHERLLTSLGLLVAVVVAGALLARRNARRHRT